MKAKQSSFFEKLIVSKAVALHNFVETLKLSVDIDVFTFLFWKSEQEKVKSYQEKISKWQGQVSERLGVLSQRGGSTY